MDPSAEIQALKQESARQAARIAALERAMLQPTAKRKPVNRKAFDVAFAAWMDGKPKALNEYVKHYAIP